MPVIVFRVIYLCLLAPLASFLKNILISTAYPLGGDCNKIINKKYKITKNKSIKVSMTI